MGGNGFFFCTGNLWARLSDQFFRFYFLESFLHLFSFNSLDIGIPTPITNTPEPCTLGWEKVRWHSTLPGKH